MKQSKLNINGINLNAKCVGGKNLKEWLEGKTIECALYNAARDYEDSIEEGIADSLNYDKAYAPEWFKVQMQNLDFIIPDETKRNYIKSMIG